MSKVLVNYIGKSGGGPAFAFEFAKGLANNGFDVYVVVSEYVDNKVDWGKCDLYKDVYFVKTNRLRGKQYYLKTQMEFIFWGNTNLNVILRRLSLIMLLLQCSIYRVSKLLKLLIPFVALIY